MEQQATKKLPRFEPLYDRVDRNRVKLAAYVTAFVAGSVLTIDLMFAIMAVVIGVPVFMLLDRTPGPVAWGYQLPSIYNTTNEHMAPVMRALFIGVTLAGLVAAIAWATYTLMRSETWLLKRLGATFVPKGELLPTKYALKDMAHCAGFFPAPALYLLDSANVNAFIFAARRRRAVIGVTKGFVDRLDEDEQRAAFANLIARLGSGDTIAATGLTALMWPMHEWRNARMRDSVESDFPDEPMPAFVARKSMPALGVLTVWFFMWGFLFVTAIEAIAYGSREQQLALAAKADAEAMLLLKEPAPMLKSLVKAIRYDNYVPTSGEAFAQLFWCWPGPSSNDADDPEWNRIRQLLEVLGVEGQGIVELPEDALSDQAAAVLVPPKAPWLEELEARSAVEMPGRAEESRPEGVSAGSPLIAAAVAMSPASPIRYEELSDEAIAIDFAARGGMPGTPEESTLYSDWFRGLPGAKFDVLLARGREVVLSGAFDAAARMVLQPAGKDQVQAALIEGHKLSPKEAAAVAYFAERLPKCARDARAAGGAQEAVLAALQAEAPGFSSELYGEALGE